MRLVVILAVLLVVLLVLAVLLFVSMCFLFLFFLYVGPFSLRVMLVLMRSIWWSAGR